MTTIPDSAWIVLLDNNDSVIWFYHCHIILNRSALLEAINPNSGYVRANSMYGYVFDARLTIHEFRKFASERWKHEKYLFYRLKNSQWYYAESVDHNIIKVDNSLILKD